MSDAADELERMAEELRVLSDRSEADWRSNGDHVDQGRADGLWTAHERLLGRARRLRALANSLPKPDRVDVGQWWALGNMNEVDVPGRIERMGPERAYLRTEHGLPWDASHLGMLSDERWYYFGDGDVPSGSALANAVADEVVEVGVGNGATVMSSSREFRVRYEEAPMPGKTIRISIERHQK